MVDYPNVEQDLLEWELRIRIRGNTQLPKAISNLTLCPNTAASGGAKKAKNGNKANDDEL